MMIQQVREQFKANMHELDDEKVRGMLFAALAAVADTPMAYI